jgi:hypothetical protein
VSRTIKPFKVKQKPLSGRDYLTVALISGVTKAGVHRDNRKHNNKFACRGQTMPAAVLAHVPKHDVSTDWERDTDLFRVYANMVPAAGKDSIQVVQIHLLDDALQPQAVINTSMFNDNEWDSILDAVGEEWRRQNPEAG